MHLIVRSGVPAPPTIQLPSPDVPRSPPSPAQPRPPPLFSPQVPRGSDNTTANQLCRSLLLSDRARVDVSPTLEILTDDVQCTHGATVADLDDEMIFYLQARGLSRPQVRGARPPTPRIHTPIHPHAHSCTLSHVPAHLPSDLPSRPHRRVC